MPTKRCNDTKEEEPKRSRLPEAGGRGGGEAAIDIARKNQGQPWLKTIRSHSEGSETKRRS